MYFLIDGYNLLFSWLDENKGPIEKKRLQLVHLLQHEFDRLGLRGIIVFDGAHRRDEESGLSYPNPMEVAFTPKGQTADENILERIEFCEPGIDPTVISNDLGLKRQVRALGVKIMSNQAFLKWLLKKGSKKKGKHPSPKDSPKQIERLLKIFEERLERELEE